MHNNFEFTTTAINRSLRTGEVHITGHWLAGRIKNGQALTLSRTGEQIVVNSVRVGTGALELVLECGHVQPALSAVKPGDLIVGGE
jgi:hypothetical protein